MAAAHPNLNERAQTLLKALVERYITDTAWERGWVQPIKPLRELSQSIGIIGAGPAGMAAAEQLRLAAVSHFTCIHISVEITGRPHPRPCRRPYTYSDPG
jgi:heterodisulfide reductase subunit A-like polyferredoxin